MRRIKVIARLIKWSLRVVLIIVITFMLIDRGMDELYSLITATVVMIFWIWCIALDYKINPIIKWDEDNEL